MATFATRQLLDSFNNAICCASLLGCIRNAFLQEGGQIVRKEFLPRKRYM